MDSMQDTVLCTARVLHTKAVLLNPACLFLSYKPGSSESRLKYVQLSQLYWSKETWWSLSGRFHLRQEVFETITLVFKM